MTENDTMNLKKNIEIHYDGRKVLCFANRPNDFLEIFKHVVKTHPNRIALCFNEKIINHFYLGYSGNSKSNQHLVSTLLKEGFSINDFK